MLYDENNTKIDDGNTIFIKVFITSNNDGDDS